MKKRVLVLGATGSIGTSSLDILKNYPQKFELVGFSVHSNISQAEKIKQEFSVNDFCSTKKAEFSDRYQIDTDAIKKLIDKTKPDIIINGIAGSAGLKASILSLESGIDLALANKETIVNAGFLIRDLAKAKGANLLPVDSEHSAIFNLINAHGKANIERIIITASGGPFRNTPKEDLAKIELEDALKHPTWNMGRKITIDSASLANKALEVIEAVKLFDMPVNKVSVTVHPQSIVHSMVQTVNGEVYAQMSHPNMKNPIFNALAFPDLAPEYLKPLDFTKALNLEFIPPRMDDFTMLKLGFESAEKLALYPLAFNCANEEAVDAFVERRIRFVDIPIVTQEVLNSDWSKPAYSFEEVFNAENSAREKARAVIKKLEA